MPCVKNICPTANGVLPQDNKERYAGIQHGLEQVSEAKNNVNEILIARIEGVQLFGSPVQPALIPGSPRTAVFYVLIIGLPQGRDKEQ